MSHTLKALGSVCVRHYEFMLRPELKEFYHQLLTSDLAPIEMKADVLRNIEMYLQEEEQRMIRQDKECKYIYYEHLINFEINLKNLWVISLLLTYSVVV